ncbi:MAG: segregation and condensation protein A [Pleomorphochaeta sp.]
MVDSNLELNKKDNSHSFKTPSFEGPLELLLFLIQKSQINIYDIPIALITEQFLEYINNDDTIELDQLSDFYKMAADLLYIKSRMLLPVDIDYDEDYEDPRQDLVQQLLEYQKYRKYTELLTNTANSEDLYIERKKSTFMIPFEDQQLFENITLNKLLKTFTSIMEKISPAKVFNIYEEVSVNEKLALMNEIFETKDELTIEELIVHLDKPLHIICAFMAILEACKFKMIYIAQKIPYETIIIKKRSEVSIEDDEADLIDEMYEKALDQGLYNENELNDEIDKDDYSINEDSLDEEFKPKEDAELMEFGEFEEIDLDDD